MVNLDEEYLATDEKIARTLGDKPMFRKAVLKEINRSPHALDKAIIYMRKYGLLEKEIKSKIGFNGQVVYKLTDKGKEVYKI